MASNLSSNQLKPKIKSNPSLKKRALNAKISKNNDNQVKSKKYYWQSDSTLYLINPSNPQA